MFRQAQHDRCFLPNLGIIHVTLSSSKCSSTFLSKGTSAGIHEIGKT